MGLRKFSLWCFFAFYLILPEYFALEISSSLPLLTASRCILLLLLVNCMLKKRISVHIDKRFMTYAIILLVVDTYHLTTNSGEAIKAMFTIIVEQIILYIVLKNLIASKRVLISGINLMVKVSGVVSILAIIEALTGVNVFYFLTTTNREMLQASYERLGFLRAEASFGHPVYFSVYLICILPFTLYFFEKTNKKIYALIATMNIFAIFCSGSRGGIAVLAVLVLCSIFFKRDTIKFKYLKHLATIIPIVIVVFIVFLPQVFDYFSGLVGSILSAFGFNVDIEGFGGNASGIDSRLMQFSGLLWAQEHNALFLGFGPGAHKYGLISYINAISGAWNTTYSIDIGYIGYVLQYGIVGAIGYAILYVSVTIKAWKKSNKIQVNNLFNAFKYFYIIYLASLTSSVGLNSMFFVVTILMLIYIDLERSECNNGKGNASGSVRGSVGIG